MLFEIYFQKILKWCGKTLIWNCSCCQSLIYISLHWIVNYHFHSCLCWFCFQPSIYIFRACCGNLANISFVKFTSSKKHPDKSEFLYFLFLYEKVASTARLNSNLGNSIRQNVVFFYGGAFCFIVHIKANEVTPVDKPKYKMKVGIWTSSETNKDWGKDNGHSVHRWIPFKRIPNSSNASFTIFAKSVLIWKTQSFNKNIGYSSEALHTMRKAPWTRLTTILGMWQ